MTMTTMKRLTLLLCAFWVLGAQAPVPLYDLVEHWALTEVPITSTSSNTIGTGSKSFTLSQACPATYTVGLVIKAYDAANPANLLSGPMTSCTGSTVVLNVNVTGGAGTITSWKLSTPRAGSLSTSLPPVNPRGFQLQDTLVAAGSSAGVFPDFLGSQKQFLNPSNSVGQGYGPPGDMTCAGSCAMVLRIKWATLPVADSVIWSENGTAYYLMYKASDHSIRWSTQSGTTDGTAGTTTTICWGSANCSAPNAALANHEYLITAGWNAATQSQYLVVVTDTGSLTRTTSATGLGVRMLAVAATNQLGAGVQGPASGTIRDASFFKSALTDTQITWLYNSGTPRSFSEYTLANTGYGRSPYNITLTSSNFANTDQTGTAGIVFFRPYHLSAWSPSVATARGGNYVWAFSPDHIGFPNAPPAGHAATGLWLGYSNSPTVAPTSYTKVIAGPTVPGVIIVGGVQYAKFEQPHLAYNAADPNGRPFYAYMTAEMSAAPSGCSEAQQSILYSSADLVTWTYENVANPAYCFPSLPFSSPSAYNLAGFMNVFAPGELPGQTDWVSYNSGNTAARVAYALHSSNPKLFNMNAVGQDVRELDRSAAFPGGYNTVDWPQGLFTDGTNVYAFGNGFQPNGRGVSLVKLSFNNGVWRQPTGELWDTGIHAFDVYPSMGYIQSLQVYQESGTVYLYVVRGYYSANGFRQEVDVYTATPDTTTSAAITYDIKADFGAACDGVANDDTAFLAFRTAAQTWQSTHTGRIDLVIPPDVSTAKKCSFLSAGTGTRFADGLKQFRLLGNGATLSDGGTGNGFFLGGQGQVQDNLHSARLQNCSAGATICNLVNSGDASKFALNQWVLISGLDQQGYGYPTNPRFFEYRQISGISGAAISFTAPIQNSYQSSWPVYDAGSVSSVDQGGPATIYSLPTSWDTQQEYIGITIDQAGQTYAQGRSLTFRDVNVLGTNGLIPTQVGTLTWDKVVCLACNLEVDKLVDTWSVSGSMFRQLLFQSSSINLFSLRDSIVSSSMNGSPISSTMARSYFASLSPGAYAFGNTDQITCNGCIIAELLPGGISEALTDYSMSSGILSVANSHGPVTWAVPGRQVFWSCGIYLACGSFTVVNVSQVGANTLIQTNLSGNFPVLSGTLGVHTVPAPAATCTFCTVGGGLANLWNANSGAYDWSQATPGRPLFTYSKRVYHAEDTSSITPTAYLMGKLSAVTLDVTAAYTGVQSTLTSEALGIGGTNAITLAGTVTAYDPVPNLKTTGTRSMTTASVSGAKAGDSGLPFSDAAWLVHVYGPKLSADISGESSSLWPTYSVEISTTLDAFPPDFGRSTGVRGAGRATSGVKK